VPWEPPTGQSLPSSNVRRVLAARDGTLWVGTIKGLASWKHGKITQHKELEGLNVASLLEDREGSVWAGGIGPSGGRLCAAPHGAVRCDRADRRRGETV